MMGSSSGFWDNWATKLRSSSTCRLSSSLEEIEDSIGRFQSWALTFVSGWCHFPFLYLLFALPPGASLLPLAFLPIIMSSSAMSSKRAAKDCAVLSIAGSDPSGGAGIQVSSQPILACTRVSNLIWYRFKADLKTFAAHGCYGMSVITSLTAQNTLGVRNVHGIPPTFVAEQVRWSRYVQASFGSFTVTDQFSDPSCPRRRRDARN